MHTPIQLDHSSLAIFLRNIGVAHSAVTVPAHLTIQKPAGYCYWNVDAVVKDIGGAMILGWGLYCLPGLYLYAEHHAVWKSPDGGMWDVTGTAHAPSDHTVFVIDKRFKVDLERPPCFDNRYLRLNKHKRVDKVIAADHELTAASRERVNAAHASGYRGENQFLIARGLTPTVATRVSDPQKWKQMNDRHQVAHQRLTSAFNDACRLIN